jgi:4-hydroxybenzoate polyprenyltransferase
MLGLKQLKRLLIVLEMIKFEHTVFALPFAFLGAFLAAQGCPPIQKVVWILMAMFGARSAAMAFNRLVDRNIDEQNPRTANRALPLQILTPSFVGAFIAASAAIFLFSAWMLNPLAFTLSPLALGIVLLYSFTKRFTWLSHLILGLSLAIAPVGGWVAVRGSLDVEPFYLAAAVVFWVGGFDIIYSCQDVLFDREYRLHSIPSRIGVRRALFVSRGFHVIMVAFLMGTLGVFNLSGISWFGLVLVILGLGYEHSLVKSDDLSRVNAAFFVMNGLISIVFFVFVGVDLCLNA